MILLLEDGTGGDRLFKRQGRKREQDLVWEETRFCYWEVTLLGYFSSFLHTPLFFHPPLKNISFLFPCHILSLHQPHPEIPHFQMMTGSVAPHAWALEPKPPSPLLDWDALQVGWALQERVAVYLSGELEVLRLWDCRRLAKPQNTNFSC